MESKVNLRIDVTGFGCNRWAIFISTSDTGSSDSGSRAMYNAAHLTLLKSTHLHLKNFWCLDVVFLNVYSGQNMFYLTYCNFFFFCYQELKQRISSNIPVSVPSFCGCVRFRCTSISLI